MTVFSCMESNFVIPWVVASSLMQAKSSDDFMIMQWNLVIKRWVIANPPITR